MRQCSHSTIAESADAASPCWALNLPNHPSLKFSDSSSGMHTKFANAFHFCRQTSPVRRMWPWQPRDPSSPQHLGGPPGKHALLHIYLSPLLSPLLLILQPLRYERLSQYKIRVAFVKVCSSSPLIHAILMMPVKNFNMLHQCCNLFLCEDRHCILLPAQCESLFLEPLQLILCLYGWVRRWVRNHL
jgi:hypothetical protein